MAYEVPRAWPLVVRRSWRNKTHIGGICSGSVLLDVVAFFFVRRQGTRARLLNTCHLECHSENELSNIRGRSARVQWSFSGMSTLFSVAPVCVYDKSAYLDSASVVDCGVSTSSTLLGSCGLSRGCFHSYGGCRSSSTSRVVSAVTRSVLPLPTELDQHTLLHPALSVACGALALVDEAAAGTVMMVSGGDRGCST